MTRRPVCTTLVTLACIAAFAGCQAPNPAEQPLPPPASPEDQAKSTALYEDALKVQQGGDIKAAVAKWEDALKLDPRNVKCLNHYAWFLAADAPTELRDPKRALTLAIRAADLSNWNDKDVIDTVAEAYHQTGDYVRAVENGQKALQPGLAGHSKPKYLHDQLDKFQKALDASKK